MAQPQECAKCRCQAFTFKQGISKKNGKPWKGWKCDNKECGDMVFESSYPPKKPGYGYSKPASQPAGNLQDLMDILMIMDAKIAAIAKVTGADKLKEVGLVKDDEAPF